MRTEPHPQVQPDFETDAPLVHTQFGSHEASHGPPHHPPTPAIDDRGCRDWRKEIEDEADWLAGVLLIPLHGEAVRPTGELVMYGDVITDSDEDP